MHILASRDMTSVQLTFVSFPKGAYAKKVGFLRSSLGAFFKNDDRFHQHDEEGKLHYRYPHVQYRWDNERGIVLGWEESAQTLRDISWTELSLPMESVQRPVVEATIYISEGLFGVSDRLERYLLETPVLLFNQNNYRCFQTMSQSEKRIEQDRLLVAQLLVALRGLRVDFPERLYATFGAVSVAPCRYKEQTLIGLFGDFVTNAWLPDGFSFGHAVSHGFGWVRRISERTTS